MILAQTITQVGLGIRKYCTDHIPVPNFRHSASEIFISCYSMSHLCALMEASSESCRGSNVIVVYI